MTSRTKATLLILICVTLWALIPVVAKLGQAALDNHQFLFWSSLASVAILLVLAAAKGRVAGIARYTAKDWGKLLGLGLLGTYLYYLFLYLGYAHSPGVVVLVFQYTWPILIVLFSIPILKERLNTQRLIALALGFLGVATVLTEGKFHGIRIENPGVIALVVAGAASFALFSVLSKKIDNDPLIAVIIYFLSACIASLVSMLIFSEFALPTPAEIVPILLNGVLINGVSYAIWLLALRLTEASYLAPLTFITPALSAVYLVAFFNEPFTSARAIGLACILLGGLINSLGRNRLNRR